jgi:hypothetical protein
MAERVNIFGQGFVAEILPPAHCVPPMNATATRRFSERFSTHRNGSEKDRFRDKFQRSLRSCIRRGFTVEESFGMIWVETWEEVALTEEEQSALYDELIRWAKTSLLAEVRPLTTLIHQSYSRARAVA